MDETISYLDGAVLRDEITTLTSFARNDRHVTSCHCEESVALLDGRRSNLNPWDLKRVNRSESLWTVKEDNNIEDEIATLTSFARNDRRLDEIATLTSFARNDRRLDEIAALTSFARNDTSFFL